MAEVRLGVDHLTVFGMPPLAFVALAEEAGCDSVSLMAASQPEIEPWSFPQWSLTTDAGLRRETAAKLSDSGVRLELGECSVISPAYDVTALIPQIDAFCELGAARLNIATYEADPSREADQLCRFAELARERGMPFCFEFSARIRPRKLDEQAALVEQAGRPGASILLDVMHFYRARHTAADLALFDPALFPYLQLCDAPMRGEANYMLEALHDRMVPGEGEMPVAEMLAALPADIVVSMEIPQVRLANTGVPHLERVREAARKCRALLEKVAAARGG